MRKGIIASLLGIIFLMVLFENKAQDCGAGWFHSTSLPFGVGSRWFNGAFTFEDKEGLGIVYPGVVVGGHSGIPITKVERYRVVQNTIQFEFDSNGQKHVGRISSENVKLVTQSEALSKGGSWVNVDYSSCLYGSFTFVRIAIVGALLFFLVQIFRSKKEV